MTKGINLMSAGGTRLTTQPTGGGDKKAGSVPRATGFMLNSGIRHAALGRNGRGEGRAGSGFISQTNQLAGIGSKRSMTIGTADGINKSLIKNDENSFSIINESLGFVTLGAELSSEQRDVKVLLENVSQTAITFAISVWPEGFGALDAVVPNSVGQQFAEAAFDMGSFLQGMDLKTLLDEKVQFIKYLNEFITRGLAARAARVSFWQTPEPRSAGFACASALLRLWSYPDGSVRSVRSIWSPQVAQLILNAHGIVLALVK